MWTADERIHLIERYAPDGATAIAARIGRSADSVSSQARRHGLRSPDYRKRQVQKRASLSRTVNTTFFEESTPEMALALGYIWGCGSIIKRCHVLRVSCSRDERFKIDRIRRLLGSQHCIQRFEHRYVLEVCNHLLVESFVKRFGLPPGRSTDGKPPVLADGLVAGFAAGHLLGTGSRGYGYVRWRGHESVIRWLAGKIVKLAGVPKPLFTTTTKRISIRWHDDFALEAINSWLGMR
jgi:hypothetical protein